MCYCKFQIFLFNLEPEWVALFSDIPQSSHGISYRSTFEGCTDIFLPIEGTQQVNSSYSHLYTGQTAIKNPYYRGT